MSGTSRDDGLWCRRFHPADAAGQRLVCFPHAGGSASFFHPVSAALSPGVDVVAVQYPGRQDRRGEPVVDDLLELADQVFAALRPWADKPLTFFGHSMGSVVAFEVARRMESEGTGPVRLFASGRRAPSAYRDENVHQRDDAGLLAEVRSMSGTDARLLGDDDVLAMIMPALRGDYTAVERYRHQPGATVNCDLTALVGESDPRTTLAEARAWVDHTTGDFELRTFPGGHFYLSEQAPAVLAELRGHFAGAPLSAKA